MNYRKIFGFKSLTTKLVLAFALLGALGVISLTWLSYSNSRASMETMVASNYEALAKATMDKIDRNLFERYGDVQAFALAKVVTDRLSGNSIHDELSDFVNAMVQGYGIYDLMIIADTKGTVVSYNSVDKNGSTIPTSFLKDATVKGEEWFEQCMNGSVQPASAYYSDPSYFPTTEKVFGKKFATIQYASPIRNKAGEIIGAWCNYASFERIVKQITDETIAEEKKQGHSTFYLTLYNKQGMVLLDKIESTILSENVKGKLASFDAGLMGKSGSMTIYNAVDKNNEVVSYTQSVGALGYPAKGWVINTKMQENEAYSAITAARNNALIVGTVVLLIICAGGLVIARSISKPVVALSTAAERVANGDFAVLVQVQSSDEIGKLGSTFNTMIESINASHEQTQREKQKAEESATEAARIAQQAENQNLYLAQSVETIVEAMSQFAKGDLTVQLPVQGNDAIAQLYHGFNQSVDNIRLIIANVKEAIEAAASSGAQISAGTEEMSVGAREQSQQVGEVAAAMEQMSRTIDDNAQLAGKTSEIAQSSRNTAVQGGKVIEESIAKVKDIAISVESMGVTVEHLGERGKEIGQIVSTIKEIASQTNLLALNAAIEAARAGEQGRGFAVVADEVRKLAERTQSSTKEIEMKIGAIQSETMQAVEMMGKSMVLVQEGISLSDGAGQSLTSIVNSVEQVVETVDMIAKANSEQAIVGATVARNVENISNVSQEMAKGLGDVANATTNLSQMTQNLQTLAAQFRLEIGIGNDNAKLIHNGTYRNLAYSERIHQH